MGQLPNFVYALVQKPMKISSRNFIVRYFILRLRADSIWVEIGPKIRGWA